MGEEFNIDIFLQNLWMRENLQGYKEIEGKGGYKNGRYFPYQGTNGIDVGPGFLLKDQSKEFQKKARTTGFTKEELNDSVKESILDMRETFEKRIKKEGGNPVNLTNDVFAGLMDMQWQLGEKGLQGYDNLWKAVANNDYEGIRKETLTYWKNKRGKKYPDTNRQKFRNEVYFHDPKPAYNLLVPEIQYTAPSDATRVTRPVVLPIKREAFGGNLFEGGGYKPLPALPSSKGAEYTTDIFPDVWEYMRSPLFIQRAKEMTGGNTAKAQHLVNTAREHIKGTRFSHDIDQLSDSYNQGEMKVGHHIHMGIDGSVQDVDMDYNSVAAHEIGHSVYPANPSSPTLPIQWDDFSEKYRNTLLRGKSLGRGELEDEHDSKPIEKLGTIYEAQQQAKEAELWDKYSGKPFTPEMWEKFKEKYPNARINGWNDEDAIWLINTTAQNQYTPNKYNTPETERNLLADGGTLNSPKKWDDLSFQEKSAMMKVAIKNGTYSLPEIRRKYNEYAEGGKIHIDESKRGTFTATAEEHNMSVQEYAAKILANPEQYSPEMRRKAIFAKNAAKWHCYGGNLFKEGGYKPSEEIKKRIAEYEGKAMTGAIDPLSGKYAKNNSYGAEAKGFYNALPESIRDLVLSNPQLADNLYSYSYNVGAGNFKKRVVPILQKYYQGQASIEDVENSMWASGDNKLRGLQRRRAQERAGVRSALLDYQMDELNAAINNPMPVIMQDPVQKYSSPLATYETPAITVSSEQPLVDAAVRDAYTPEKIAEEERRDRSAMIGSLLSNFNQSGDYSPFISAINTLTERRYSRGGHLFDGKSEPINVLYKPEENVVHRVTNVNSDYIGLDPNTGRFYDRLTGNYLGDHIALEDAVVTPSNGTIDDAGNVYQTIGGVTYMTTSDGKQIVLGEKPVSNADPIGEFFVEGAALSPAFKPIERVVGGVVGAPEIVKSGREYLGKVFNGIRIPLGEGDNFAASDIRYAFKPEESFVVHPEDFTWFDDIAVDKSVLPKYAQNPSRENLANASKLLDERFNYRDWLERIEGRSLSDEEYAAMRQRYPSEQRIVRDLSDWTDSHVLDESPNVVHIGKRGVHEPEIEETITAHEKDHAYGIPEISNEEITKEFGYIWDNYLRKKSASEMLARLGQVANWYGIKSIRKQPMTGDMLKYAASQGRYFKDANFDNNMFDFFNVLKQNNTWDSAAKMYNKYGKSLVSPIVVNSTLKTAYNNEND